MDSVPLSHTTMIGIILYMNKALNEPDSLK